MGCVTSVTGERICRKDITGDTSPKKPSPFKDPIEAAKNSGQLTLRTASKAEEALGNTSVYTFYSTQPILKCGEFKALFGIPSDKQIPNCTSNSAPLITTTMPKAELEGFVYRSELGW